MESRTLGLNTHSCIDKFINDFNFKIENDIGVHIEYILTCVDLTPDDSFESLKALMCSDNATDRGPDWTCVEFNFQSGSIPHFLFIEIREFFKTPFRTADDKYIVFVTPNFSENKIWVKFQKA
jgi:hypothetical protein